MRRLSTAWPAMALAVALYYPGSASATVASSCNSYLLANPQLQATSTTCSPTELVLYAKSPSCLSCAFAKGCLDQVPPLGGNPGECSDLQPGITTTPAECVNTLSCELGVASVDPTVLLTPPADPQVAYCGTGPGLCQTVSDGVCKAVMTAGFPAGWTTNQILQSLQVPGSTASGQAGAIWQCASQFGCSSCFSPVQAVPVGTSPGTWGFAALAAGLVASGLRGLRRRFRTS
jgi:hypothetical protein